MSRINSQELFQLIKSLSQSEKRYFKLFASRHALKGENKYAALFDAIASQDEYNEEDILREEKRFGKKQLPDLKNYLYKLIMRSLLNYHSEISVHASIKNMTRQIEILLGKGLYSQCGKLVVKARELARKHQNNRDLLEIIFWEKRWLDGVSYAEKTSKDINRLHKEEDELLGKIRNINKSWSLYSNMILYNVKEGHPRSPEEIKMIARLRNNLFLKRKTNSILYEEKNYYFFAQELYYFAKQDWKNVYRWGKRHLAMLECELPIVQEKLNSYIGLLDNLILACIHLKKQEEAHAHIKKIHLLSSRSVYSQVRIFVRGHLLELILHSVSADPRKGLAIIPYIEDGFARFKNKINKEHQTLLYYHAFHICFLSKEYSRALEWLNKILQDNKISSREDIHCIARILNLILHFEIGNMEMLPYVIKSSERFLSKRNRLYSLEKLMLKFFRKISKTDDEKKQKEYFLLLKKDIASAADEPAIKTAYEYFNFMSWIKNKIENKSFAGAVREKAKASHTLQ